jgi:hypothetical protein
VTGWPNFSLPLGLRFFLALSWNRANVPSLENDERLLWVEAV